MSNLDRQAQRLRKTGETEITIKLMLDMPGIIAIDTGFGLFNHMLSLLAFWAGFSLSVKCKGDLDVDAHHTVEDVGLCLGGCLLECLADKKGIERTGYGRVPMDEALADVTVDLSGRPWLVWRNDVILPPVIAGEERDIWREFYKALSSAGKFNLHIDFLYGKNGHHLLESAAKGCGVALRKAAAVTGNCLRSTKGELD